MSHAYVLVSLSVHSATGHSSVSIAAPSSPCPWALSAVAVSPFHGVYALPNPEMVRAEHPHRLPCTDLDVLTVDLLKDESRLPSDTDQESGLANKDSQLGRSYCSSSSASEDFQLMRKPVRRIRTETLLPTYGIRTDLQR